MKTDPAEQALRYALAKHIVDVARVIQKRDLPRDFNPEMLFAFINSAANVTIETHGKNNSNGKTIRPLDCPV